MADHRAPSTPVLLLILCLILLLSAFCVYHTFFLYYT